MKTFLYLIYSIVLLFCFYSSAVLALTIGTEDIQYYPHYGKISDKSTEFEGIARSFFDDFSAKKNIVIDYKPQPIKRLYVSLLVDESIDFKYPDSPFWNIEQKAKSNKKIYYSEPISRYLDGVFVHKDNKNMKLDDIDHLGLLRGFTPEPFKADILSGKIKISEFSYAKNLLKALKEKLVDAIYINTDIAHYQMAKNGITDIEFNKNLPFSEGYYYISSIKHPNVIKLINEYIAENNEYIKKLKHDVKVIK